MAGHVQKYNIQNIQYEKKIKIIMAALSTRKSIRKLLKNPADKTN